MAEPEFKAGMSERGAVGHVVGHAEYQGGECESGQSGYGGEHHPFGKYLHNDVARFGAYGTAYAYLLCAFLDYDPHDIAYSYYSGHKCPGADEERYQAERREEHVDLAELLRYILKVESIVVIGVYGMIRADDTFESRTHVRGPEARFGREEKHIHVCTAVERTAQCGEGECHRVIDA